MTQWNSGDLALCVRDDWARDAKPDEIRDAPFIPRKGAIYTVTGLRTARMLGETVLYLKLEGGGDWGFLAEKFRRIAPLTDAEHRQAVEDLRVPEVVS